MTPPLSLLLLALLSLRSPAHGQADPRPAQVSDLAITRDGKALFVADPGRGLVLRYRLDSDAGPGPAEVVFDAATEPRVQWPGRIAVRSSEGPLYISDTRTHRVGRVDLMTGRWRTLCGLGHPGLGHTDGSAAAPAATCALSHPGGIALRDARTLLIADTGNRVLRAVDLEKGQIRNLAGGASDMLLPVDVAVGASGEVVFLDGARFAAMRWNPAEAAWLRVRGSRVPRLAQRRDLALRAGRILFAGGPEGGYGSLPSGGGEVQKVVGRGWSVAVAAAADGSTWSLDAAQARLLRWRAGKAEVMAQLPHRASQPELQVIRREPDPEIVRDAGLRAAIRAVGRPWLVRDLRTGIDFVLLPPGRFRMGEAEPAQDVRGDATPAHEVAINKAFYLGRTEVSGAQFRLLEPNHVSLLSPHHRLDHRSAALSLDGDLQPASGLSWFDARDFAQRFGYRLPTEVEWEYAARGGSQTAYPWGAELAAGVAFANLAGPALASLIERELQIVPYEDGHLLAAPVGSLRPNGLGLHDCIGNVWEWCADVYRADAYPRAAGREVAARAAASGKRVLRGSSWQNPFRGAPRVAFRGQTRPGAHHVLSRGFRVVLDLF